MKKEEKGGKALGPYLMLAVLFHVCPACFNKRLHTDKEWKFHSKAGCGVDKLWHAPK